MPIYVWLTHISQLAKQIFISGPDSCRLLTDGPPKHPTMRSPKRKQPPHWSVAMDKSHLHSDRVVAQGRLPKPATPGNEKSFPSPPAPHLKSSDGGGERRREEPDTGAAQRETHSLRIPQTQTWLKTHRSTGSISPWRTQMPLGSRGWKLLLNQGNPQSFSVKHGFSFQTNQEE